LTVPPGCTPAIRLIPSHIRAESRGAAKE